MLSNNFYDVLESLLTRSYRTVIPNFQFAPNNPFGIPRPTAWCNTQDDVIGNNAKTISLNGSENNSYKNKSLDDRCKIIFRNVFHLKLCFPGQTNSEKNHFI